MLRDVTDNDVKDNAYWRPALAMHQNEGRCTVWSKRMW